MNWLTNKKVTKMLSWIYLISCRSNRNLLSGPILDSEGMGVFLGAYFSEKRAFWLLAPPKQMPFLTISDKNIFFKTQGTRLGAIVAPNKCLE